MSSLSSRSTPPDADPGTVQLDCSLWAERGESGDVTLTLDVDGIRGTVDVTDSFTDDQLADISAQMDQAIKDRQQSEPEFTGE